MVELSSSYTYEQGCIEYVDKTRVHNIQRLSFCHEVFPVDLCIYLKAEPQSRYMISLPPKRSSAWHLQGSQAMVIKNFFANRVVYSLSQEMEDFSSIWYFWISGAWHFGRRDSVIKIWLTLATNGNAITNQKHCLIAIIVYLYWEGWTLSRQ